MGSFLCAEGILREPEPASNEGQFDRKTYYRMLGIYYTMGNADIEILDSRADPLREALWQIRFLLRGRIEEVFPSRTAGVMSAMLVGDRSLMEAEDSDRFRMAGVSHVLVISGLHITMMAEAFYRILCHMAVAVPIRKDRKDGRQENVRPKRKRTQREDACEEHVAEQYLSPGRKRSPDREEHNRRDRLSSHVRILHMNKKAAAVMTMFLLVCCAVMTGLSVSTVRAVFMYCLAVGARLTGRTYDPLTGVSLAAAVILTVNPEYLTYSGFQLSFLAVIILGLCSDRGPLMRGVILYLGTVPFILCSWYEIPLYGVFLNLLIVPLIPFVLGAGILGIVCGSAFGGIFTMPAVGLVELLYCILRLAEHDCSSGQDPDLRGAVRSVPFPFRQMEDGQKKIPSARDAPDPSYGVPRAGKGRSRDPHAGYRAGGFDRCGNARRTEHSRGRGIDDSDGRRQVPDPALPQI